MPIKGKNELASLTTIPLAAIGVAFVVAVLISVFIVRGHVRHAHTNALIAEAANSAQFQVNERESNLIKQIDDAATSKVLANLVASGDSAAIAAEQQQLEAIFPNAIRVRLFSPGGAKVDHNENPPFSFTSLDMVNRIETGRSVYPEAISHDGHWILSVAAPIKADAHDAIRGTLFAYLDMRALSGGLSGTDNGRIKIVQTYHNVTPVDILTMGAKGPGDQQVTRTLNNPGWTIEFAPSTRVLNSPVSSLIWFLIAPLVFLLIALFGAIYSIRRLLARVSDDAALLANQMVAVASDHYEQSENYKIRAFVDLDANLARLAQQHPHEQIETPPVDVETPPLDVEPQVTDTPAKEDKAVQATGEHGSKPTAPGKYAAPTAEIFRAYDIRGVVNRTLTPDVIRKIGLAIGTEAGEMGQQTLIVGADGRVSSPAVLKCLIEGLNKSGRDVVNIGSVPTPILYFATHRSEARSGVMVTASHNPPEYNGFKIVLDGRTLIDSDIQKLYQRFQSEDFSSGQGQMTEMDITGDYVDAITDDIAVGRSLKVVVDCGNGVAGLVAPELFENLGCDVTPLYCDVDGRFPNHSPDPLVPENLRDLIVTVKSQGADLGVALDGDGDRLVAVTGEGEIVWPDRLLMLFAKDVVSRNPGSDIVYDVKCSRHLNSVISSFGGRPIICRSGHSFVKAKMVETGAILGGEMSGHVCFSDRWFGFDDGLYSAARLLEIIGDQALGLTALLNEFPVSVSTPEIHIAVAESDKFKLIEALLNAADFEDGTVTTIDGLRVDFADGWGLIRASNTGPGLTLRFEADDETSLTSIKNRFRELLHKVDSNLDF